MCVMKANFKSLNILANPATCITGALLQTHSSAKNVSWRSSTLYAGIWTNLLQTRWKRGRDKRAKKVSEGFLQGSETLIPIHCPSIGFYLDQANQHRVPVSLSLSVPTTCTYISCRGPCVFHAFLWFHFTMSLISIQTLPNQDTDMFMKWICPANLAYSHNHHPEVPEKYL